MDLHQAEWNTLALGFANQVGNIGAILVAILSAVFFTILLVAGTTVAQSVRERLQELAVLKALGFTHGGVLALVLAEACTLTPSCRWRLFRKGAGPPHHGHRDSRGQRPPGTRPTHGRPEHQEGVAQLLVVGANLGTGGSMPA